MTGSRSHVLRFAMAFTGMVLAFANAQTQLASARVGTDPYTGGEKANLERARYASLGPFEFGNAHTTTTIEALLGDERLHWIETEHFHLGCALSELSLKRGDKQWIKSVKAELKRLRERLPTIKKSVRRLDPWLRAHLIAQRLEDLYAKVQTDLGWNGRKFPEKPMNPADAASYMGKGPYLGMQQKYAVLIVRRGASLARYTRAHASGETREPFRFHAPGVGTLVFVIAEESSEGLMGNDQALHSQLAYNVAVNLINGYRSYGHDLPPWLTFGIAHHYSRQVSPRYPAYERKGDGDEEDSSFWKWDERARGLLKHDVFESLTDLFLRERIANFDMEQHIQAWSLVDFLMRERPKELGMLVHGLKAPFHQQHKLPSHKELLARQDECVKAAFDLTVEELEAVWRKGATKRRR
ncbi:MAG: hypothetical protein NXI31_12495 [bacterium]|nr:hypothetical protein [bacterium]